MEFDKKIKKSNKPETLKKSLKLYFEYCEQKIKNIMKSVGIISTSLTKSVLRPINARKK